MSDTGRLWKQHRRGCGSNTVVGDFYGTWKYDDDEYVIVLNEDGTWDAYSSDGTYAGSSNYDYEDEMVTLYDGSQTAVLSLSVDGTKSRGR